MARAVRRPQIWKFIGVTMISDIIALLEWRAANDAQTVWVNTACEKERSQKNLSKPILWYCNLYKFEFVYRLVNKVDHITKSLQRSGKLIILFIQLKTDKPPPVLINVLIGAIFEHIGLTTYSVATRLRCGGIFCDHSVRQSL